MSDIRDNKRKQLAVSLRRGGYSYSEIQNFVSVPKATLNHWFKDLKLTEPQIERLRKKRTEGAVAGSKNRIDNIARRIEEIKEKTSSEVGTISTRELWLMGVVLYWKNHNVSDVTKGVHFMSGDPFLVRLFLRWLKDVGKLDQKEIILDLFLKSKTGKAKDEAIDFWSGCTGFPVKDFTHVYKHRNRSRFGLLQVRVRSSSMLARQLSGWIKGIQDYL